MSDEINEQLNKLDALYGELKRDYERGDLSLEALARVQLDTMLIVGKLALELLGITTSPFGRF